VPTGVFEDSARARMSLRGRTMNTLTEAVRGIDLAGLPPWLAAYVKRHGRLPPTARVKCGGKRRRDGEPCQAPSVPGRRRCRWHGGHSTGPRTEEGKARCARNLRP